MRRDPGRLRILVSELRLTADERRAAKAERRVEEKLRRERDWGDPRACRRAAEEAEARRWTPYCL